MKKLYIIFLFLFFSYFCNAEQNKYGGTLRMASSSDPKTFNLIIAQETSTTDAVGLLFEGLTRINGETTETEPALAFSWTHSENGLEWIFNLREDVKWFDGKNFTADDVVFTYNQLIYNETIPCSARDIFTIEGKPFKVEKIDTYKIKITTPTPYAPLLYHLSQPILPKHILEESVNQGKFSEIWGINTPPKKIIGTGPFKLVEYLPSQRLVYERNPNYWRKGGAQFLQNNSATSANASVADTGQALPYIEKIVTYIVQNQDAQLLKFRSGETDIVSIQGKDYALLKSEEKNKSRPFLQDIKPHRKDLSISSSSPQQATEFSEKERDKGYTVYDCGPGFGTDFITFNLNPIYTDKTKLEWFSDIKFRKAIAYAIDRESMINNVLSGMGIPQYAAMNESAKTFYNPNVKRYKYNPVKAKEFLKDAGFIDSDNDGILEKPKGTPVKFIMLTNAENNIRVDIGTIIQSDLKAIGLDVSFRPVDFNNLVTKLNYTHDWDSVLIGFTGGIEPHSGKNVWATDGHLHIWNMQPQSTQSKGTENEKQIKTTPMENTEENKDKNFQIWQSSLTPWEKEIDALFNKGVQELNPEKRKEIYWKWQVLAADNLPLIYTINSKALFAVRNTLKNIHPTAYGGALHNIEEIYIEKAI